MHRLARRIFLLTVHVALLSGCGGGGGGGPLLTAINPQVAGTISGLGSVIVNGVRYETIGATVVDMDEQYPVNAPLGLGMTVGINPLTSSPTTAGTIFIQTGIKGVASRVDSATQTLNVAGIPVTTDASTFIVASTGQTGSFASLRDDLPLEVYGLPQSDGTFKATRIEIESTVERVQLVGVVSNLDSQNKTFTLGSGINSVSVGYSGVAAPSSLANGSVVSVHTAATASAQHYTATRVYLRSADASTFVQYDAKYGGTSRIRNEANELYGMVSNFTGVAPFAGGCSMQVQGVPTTIRSATLCASLQNGDYVEVKGLLKNGALAAYRLEFKTAGGDRSLSGYSDDENDRDGDELKYRRQYHPAGAGDMDASAARSTYEIYGTLSACSNDSCTLESNGTRLIADVSTAYWEHARVSSGFVEAKGYMTGANTFKVIKLEAKR